MSTDPTEPRSQPPSAARFAVAAGLVLAVVAVYARVAGHPFTGYDDPEYVASNARVLRGLSLDNVAWAFTTLHFANWHPLTWLSLMLDASLFGASPGAFHLVNVALHAANAVLVLLVLERLTGAFWRSALVAAVFAVHPTRVESVAWVAERKDVLSIFFGLLALLAYASYARRPSPRGWAFVALAFAASLASKAMLVTLPFVLLLLDVWPLGRSTLAGLASRRSWPLWREKLPLLALALVASVLASVAQSRWGAVSEVPLGERAANAVVGIVRYAGLVAWPVDLAFFYPLPVGGWAAWQVAGAAFLVLAATVGALAVAGRLPWVTVGWCWFAGTLVPVSGLIQLGAASIADRYTYFPAVGLLVALVWSVPAPASLAARRALAAGAVVVVAVLGILSFQQVGLWRDEVTLFEHTLAVTGPNARAHGVLALRLRDRKDLQGAYEHILEANRILPGSPRDLLNLAVIASEVGDRDTAEHAFRSSIESGPRFMAARFGYADFLRKAGRAPEALQVFRDAVAADPANGTARAELAIQLAMLGQLEEAWQAFAEAQRVAPADANVQRNAGIFYSRAGAWPQAVDAFSRAAAARPGDPDILRRLSQAQAAAAGQLAPR
ncbi:MAG: tetratricopeptide repeat protein [Anaeromyxobacteraceae bacterium]